MYGLGRAGQLDRAWRWMQRMRMSGVKPNSIFALTFINAHTKARQSKYRTRALEVRRCSND
jgi:pentatricopeptide repeat protein